MTAAGRGRFLTLEGGEGTGKSTQGALLAAWLEKARGVGVVATREPGGTPAAEAVRALLLGGETGGWDAMGEALLHFAARRAHVCDVIAPALARGDWVVCDRFTDSTMAYQGYAMGLGRGMVESLQRLAIGALSPDLTVILDLPAAAGLARARARGGSDRYEAREDEFHESLRDAFLDIARREPDRCVVVDARGDAAAVAAAVRAAVTDHFGDD